MKNSWFLILAAFVIPCMPMHGLDLFKKAQTIKLARSYQVGMKTHEVLMISNRTSLKFGNQPPRITQQDFKLECDITVLKLLKGHWTELEVKATAIAFPRQGKERAFTAINVPLLASRLGDAVSFKRQDGKLLENYETDLLKRFFVAPGKSSPDDVFGTSTPVKPGDSWTVQVSKTANLLAETTKKAMTCEPRHTKGRMTLHRLWKHKGHQYQQIGGTITYEPITVRGDKFRGMIAPTCKGSLSISYQLPVELSLPAAKMEETFNWTLTARQKDTANGTQFTMTNRSKMTRHIRILEKPVTGKQ